ncbi:MAG: DUF72 domain-containing protein [Planctomycetota bacterium]|nr:DUF72 domain-containing protein [Planctomycetota bacterium]
MDLYCGTSGYAYDAWAGKFYPEDLPQDDRLRYYASQLNAVEINSTFYRSPRKDVVAKWAEAVPDDFKLVIKGNQRITHRARLLDVEGPLGYFVPAVLEAGAKLGPVLFQTPPNLKKDAGRLRGFLDQLPDAIRAAMEFRNKSWDDDETRQVLADANAALVVAEDGAAPEVHATADFGYLRLRREDYSEVDLDRWATTIEGQSWSECYAFLKHEDGAVAPRLAAGLRLRCST